MIGTADFVAHQLQFNDIAGNYCKSQNTVLKNLKIIGTFLSYKAKAGRGKSIPPDSFRVSTRWCDRGQNLMNFPVYRLKIGPSVAELFSFKVFGRKFILKYISKFQTSPGSLGISIQNKNF